MKKVIVVVATLVLGVFILNHIPKPEAKVSPVPVRPIKPEPRPEPKPHPKPKPKPRRPWRAPDSGVKPGKPVEGGRVSPDGLEELQVDLPRSQRKKNIASQGLGCCVFRANEYLGRWQDQPEMFDLPEKMVKVGIAGGGWPDKFDKVMAKLAPHVRYIQDTSGDPAILKAILASGRGAGVTYNGHDCHYSGTIAHMVTLVHFSDQWACISDNNFIEENQFVWMSLDEFMTRWKGAGGGWATCLLGPPPPPVPHNRGSQNVKYFAPLSLLLLPCSGGAYFDPLPPLPVQSSAYAWKVCPTDKDQIALLRHGRQIGNYRVSDQQYYPIRNGQFCPAEEPPAGLPDGYQLRKPEPMFGVDQKEIRQGQHILNGRPVSRDELLGAISDVPADSNLLRLTVIGPDAERQKVLADIQSDPALKDQTARMLVYSFAPDAWQVVGAGFNLTGSPRIVVETPDGLVLHSQGDYIGGATALAGALRKANEQYDKKDSDLRQVDLLEELKKLWAKLDDVPAIVWIGGGVGLVLWLRRKEEE